MTSQSCSQKLTIKAFAISGFKVDLNFFSIKPLDVIHIQPEGGTIHLANLSTRQRETAVEPSWATL
jgi:hypothetical protein